MNKFLLSRNSFIFDFQLQNGNPRISKQTNKFFLPTTFFILNYGRKNFSLFSVFKEKFFFQSTQVELFFLNNFRDLHGPSAFKNREVENVDGDPPSSQSSERRADGRRWYLGWLSLNSRRFVDEFFFDDGLVLIDSAKSQAMCN